jgi:predicted nucleic acid-binding Zn ribbon protein
VIAEWRGLPERPAPRDNAQPLGTALSKVMKALGLADRLHEEDVKQAWREVVGEFLATHSSPSSLKDGVLFVRVLQPTLHYELDRVWKPQLIQKLRARFGAKSVRDIRFRIG